MWRHGPVKTSHPCLAASEDALYDALDNYSMGVGLMSRGRGLAAGFLLAGGVILSAPAAHAAQVVNVPPVPVPVPVSTAPTLHMFDCQGTTGDRGCGAGFFWRDGWRGFGCYPC